MFSVELRNFRAFKATGAVEIRPITLIVGENSTGKTSFLAALRQVLESLRGPSSGFNRAPYFLGSFEQIAHYRGGRSGRQSQFSLRLSIPYKLGNRAHHLTHEFFYRKGTPQPQLSEYRLSNAIAEVRLRLEEPNKLSFVSLLDKSTYEFRTQFSPRPELIYANPNYIEFILDEALSRSPEPDVVLPSWVQAAREQLQSQRQGSRFLQLRVFASAPVRTEPARTYTPSDITPSAQGAHVPLEMARRKKDAPAEWKKVKDALNEFGRHAGLFDDIDIRQLGKLDADPFQVLVSIKGPKVNLVDVGYGVSQALPIVYQLQNSNYDAFLIQQPEVHLHPKAQAELGTLLVSLTTAAKRQKLFVVETHSDYLVDRVRIEVAAGTISPELVAVIFFDRTGHDVKVTNLHLNERGEFISVPETYRTFFLKEQMRLLGL